MLSSVMGKNYSQPILPALIWMAAKNIPLNSAAQIFYHIKSKTIYEKTITVPAVIYIDVYSDGTGKLLVLTQ